MRRMIVPGENNGIVFNAKGDLLAMPDITATGASFSDLGGILQSTMGSISINSNGTYYAGQGLLSGHILHGRWVDSNHTGTALPYDQDQYGGDPNPTYVTDDEWVGDSSPSTYPFDETNYQIKWDAPTAVAGKAMNGATTQTPDSASGYVQMYHPPFVPGPYVDGGFLQNTNFTSSATNGNQVITTSGWEWNVTIKNNGTGNTINFTVRVELTNGA